MLKDYVQKWTVSLNNVYKVNCEGISTKFRMKEHRDNFRCIYWELYLQSFINFLVVLIVSGRVRHQQLDSRGVFLNFSSADHFEMLQIL